MTDSGRSLAGHATHEPSRSVSALRVGIVSAGDADDMLEMATFLQGLRISIPDPTCPSIDAVKAALEDLRSENAQLRDAVHHYGMYCHEVGRMLERAARGAAGVSEEITPKAAETVRLEGAAYAMEISPWSFVYDASEGPTEQAVNLVCSMASVKCKNKYPVGVIGREARAHYAEARHIAKAIEARKGQDRNGLDGDSHKGAVAESHLPDTSMDKGAEHG